MFTDYTAAANFEAAPADAWRHCGTEGAEQAPDQATITLTLNQVADLVELLDEVDEFFRMGPHAIDALTDFYRTRHEDDHPRFVALCLVDSVSFTALRLRRQAQGEATQQPATTKQQTSE